MDGLNLYRTDEPVNIHDLENTEVPYDIAIESLFYYSVHEKPSKWQPMKKAMGEWWNIVSFLRKNGLSHKGFDYPDWRQFALLDLNNQTRIHTRTRLSWFDNKNIEFDTSAHFYQKVSPTLPDNVIDILAMIRNGLEKNTQKMKDIVNYLSSIIYCKHLIISLNNEEYDTLLPIYINIYTLFLTKFDLHSLILKKNMFWALHSTMHMWCYEVGQLEMNSFANKEDWYIADLSLLLTIINK